VREQASSIEASAHVVLEHAKNKAAVKATPKVAPKPQAILSSLLRAFAFCVNSFSNRFLLTLSFFV